jgi:hypothetical protein
MVLSVSRVDKRHCESCGENRTLLQLREILGAEHGEDILEVARRIVESERPTQRRIAITGDDH